MAKFDRTAIEKAAVNAVSDALLRCPLLNPCFNTDDKGILDDGRIIIYESYPFSTAAHKDKVEVQIKGTQASNAIQKDGKVKHSVDLEALRSYDYSYQGIIFFKVAFTPDLEQLGIFYTLLLPSDIRKYIQKANGQNSISIELIPFPKEQTKRDSIIRRFALDRHIQMGISDTICGYLSEGDNVPPGLVNFFMIDPQTPHLSRFSYDAYSSPVYIYGTDENGHDYVIDKMNVSNIIVPKEQVNLSSGNFTCETVKYQVDREDGQFFSFSNTGITIQQLPQEKFHCAFSGGFRDYLVTAKILLGLMQTGELYINNDLLMSIKFDDPETNIKKLSKFICHLENIIVALDFLDVKLDWNVERLTEEELVYLELLADAVANRISLPVMGEHPSPLGKIIIQQQEIYFALRETDEHKYILENLFTEDFIAFGFKDEENNKLLPVNPLLILETPNYKALANINLESLELSFQKHPITTRTYSLITNKLLEILNAIDNGAILKDDLLNACEIIVNALLRYDPDDFYNRINYYQIQKRKNKRLAEADVENLMQMTNESKDHQILAAIYALLGNYDCASWHKSHCSREKRVQLETQPIRIFFEQLGLA